MQDLTPEELKQHLVLNSPLLLDVREQWEWDKCRFDKARLLPMGQIMANIDTFDKSAELVIICHHGIRSMQVARYFESIGFINVINLKGGIDAWAKTIDSSMTLY
ncbi:rhodanese-like domain-containing protein [Candidatus Thioglobus autotrophicus]|uniref:rhodanese-like domain-containing protein n=1 Tax=Candidatus Thioglobus autotrophicus TaxID=1705394 RepID=UPI00299F0CF7|nr:rhodanese-like domain-containing protein [Candidatus Thioglobus autotrophicus]WPE15757.1 rhodanese-like domain-containing protein [Candidatus Thioglobus autotrophicus]WPE18809.1 rhodanese-like domain-containing protein [Candidatus Thioglobus autotrophicus]